jgi:hypothetical protein
VVRGGRGSLERRSSQTAGQLLNHGLISADIAGQTIAINSNLINYATVEALNGGILCLNGQWQNQGTIRTVDSTLWLGGIFSTSNLGSLQASNSTVRLSGFIDNTGSQFSLPAGNALQAEFATIRGGALNMAAGQVLEIGTNGATLSGLTLNGDMRIPAGVVTVHHGLTQSGTTELLGAGSKLQFRYDGTYPSGTIRFNPDDPGADREIRGTNSTTLTFGPAATVHGGRGTITTNLDMTIVNQGLISADVPGQTITVFTQRFQNLGTLQAINGGILDLVGPPPFSGGSMEIINSGTMDPGLRTLSVAGTFIQTEEGTLRLGLAGDGRQGRLAVRGGLHLDGTLEVPLIGGFFPIPGMTFGLLDLELAQVQGSFASLELPGLPVGWSWDTTSLYSSGSVTVVPGPTVISSLGLSLLFAARRRSRTGAKEVAQ